VYSRVSELCFMGRNLAMDECNFGPYKSSIAPTLYDTELVFWKKWLCVQRVCTLTWNANLVHICNFYSTSSGVTYIERNISMECVCVCACARARVYCIQILQQQVCACSKLASKTSIYGITECVFLK
jgi:hypothetical protein